MKKFIGGLVVFILIIGAAFVLYNRLSGSAASNRIQQGAQTEENRSAAPDFEVTDADGKTVKLSDFKGKPVVLNFWASWCPPCKSEMPDFNEAYGEHNEKIEFLMINLTDGDRETKNIAANYVKEQGFSFPILFDERGSAARAYGVASIPATYFIDKDGNVVTHAVGALNKSLLKKGIDMLLE